MSIYQRINGVDWRNIWVVGDLHGCYALLVEKLGEVGFDTMQDLLISVGDLTDRGEENVECLALLNQPWFRAVRGNHEQMMLGCLLHNGNQDHWLMNGGGWFFELRDGGAQRVRTLLDNVSALPFIIEADVGGKTCVICHADYPSERYEFGKPIREENVIWDRLRINAALRGRVREITGADIFIFGHTPLNTSLQFANQHYIDTGAVFTGNLALLQIQGGQSHL